MVVVEAGLQRLLVREAVRPCRLRTIALLALVVVAISDHIFHLLAFRVEHLIVDAPIAAVIHQVIQAMHAELVTIGEGITHLQVCHMHIGAGTGVVVHLLAILGRRGGLAERTCAIFPTIVILGVDRPLTRVQVQHRSGVVALMPSGSYGYLQRGFVGGIEAGREIQHTGVAIRHPVDARGSAHSQPIEKERRQLNQYVTTILLHKSVRYTVDQHTYLVATTESDHSLEVSNDGGQLAQGFRCRIRYATQVLGHVQITHPLAFAQSSKTGTLHLDVLEVQGGIRRGLRIQVSSHA